MAIASAQFQLSMAATANDTSNLTVQTAVTQKRDTLQFSDGNGSLAIDAVIDTLVTVAANSTTVALSSLTSTLDEAFAFTELKAWRVSTPSTNNNTVTVSSNVTGFPTGGVLHPNTTIGFATAHANGTTIAGVNTFTVAGDNGDVANVTLFVS